MGSRGSPFGYPWVTRGLPQEKMEIIGNTIQSGVSMERPSVIPRQAAESPKNSTETPRESAGRESVETPWCFRSGMTFVRERQRT